MKRENVSQSRKSFRIDDVVSAPAFPLSLSIYLPLPLNDQVVFCCTVTRQSEKEQYTGTDLNFHLGLGSASIVNMYMQLRKVSPSMDRQIISITCITRLYLSVVMLVVSFFLRGLARESWKLVIR